MSNMGLVSESIGESYKIVEQMWNYCSGDTGDFPKLSKMEINNIKGASGTKLVTSLNVFSTWMLSKSKKD